MEKIVEFMKEKDKIRSLFDIEIVKAEKGNVITKMLVKENMLNAANVCHGGAIFSLADFTFALISNLYGNVALAINANINFVNPAYLGDELVATAEEISRSNKIGLYKITIKKEKGNKLIAFFNGEVYIKKEKLF
ncbi:MAG: hotdog fold thioesterase [Deferribacterota bacterium]|nr:hotdog fold thioesterase [Deferribacterota bacterium]